MSRSKKLGVVFVLTLFVMLGGQFLLSTGAGNVALAGDASKKLIQGKIKDLRITAEKFADAYARREFKLMYQLVIPHYRRRVPCWEYKDFVDYPGVTDGYVEVEVADVSVLPKSKYKYGKVMLKIIMVEHERSKRTGEVTKLEDEKWEFQDWVDLGGKWYKIEKFDSN